MRSAVTGGRAEGLPARGARAHDGPARGAGCFSCGRPAAYRDEEPRRPEELERLVEEPRRAVDDRPPEDALARDDDAFDREDEAFEREGEAFDRDAEAFDREDAAFAFAPDVDRLADDLALDEVERPELAFERFGVDFALRVASRWSRTASSSVAPASTRLPTASTALRAVSPTAFAASVTLWPVSRAELFTSVSLRFAPWRLRVAAAFLADACR